MPDIPEVVIQRLPLYVRLLTRLQENKTEVISSQELADQLQMTPAQIRKDLSYFGRFGKQGRGYNVGYLLSELRQILGLDREWNTAVIGVGRLGRAILGYPGFAPEGFKMIAAFDSDPRQAGMKVGDLIVRDIAELEAACATEGIDIAIVSVPAEHSQEVVERIVACGIKAILNYAPLSLQAPRDVWIRNIDPVLALQSMTFHLKRTKASRTRG